MNKHRKYEGDCWGASDCKDCHDVGRFLAAFFSLLIMGGLLFLLVVTW